MSEQFVIVGNLNIYTMLNENGFRESITCYRFLEFMEILA